MNIFSKDKKDEYSINQKIYDHIFKDKKDALKCALETREFEIGLYWQRAAYFWAFNLAALSGYIAINNSNRNQPEFSILISCIGFVVSVAWDCVNRGSKYWQENWENHVALLENNSLGALYKITFSRPKYTGLKNKIKLRNFSLMLPEKYSVSKINQCISFFFIFLWIALIIKSLPEPEISYINCPSWIPDWFICWISELPVYNWYIILACLFVFVLFLFCKSDKGGYVGLRANYRRISLDK